MGTDIHGVFQRRDDVNDRWVDIPSTYEENRDYQLFAVLADVRNGYGFAGIPTGEAIKPIALPRGLPDDFPVTESTEHIVPGVEYLAPYRQAWREKYNEPVEELCKVWMGDHSYSWLTGEEMLFWYATAPVVIKTGVIDREAYEGWNKKDPPHDWCGDIMGRDVVKINDDEISKKTTPNWTHIRVEWRSGLSEELEYFFKEVQRLVDQYGQIRFVFGFDS